MTEVTDADREKAAALWQAWITVGNEAMDDLIAAALAEERGRALAVVGAVGRCGAESPRLAHPLPDIEVSFCALPAGHAGWHRQGTTEWGIRRAAEESQ